MAESSRIQLFVKASEDGESVGSCPSCQRIFMVLLLKGVPFTLTTVDARRSPDVLKDFAPGAQLPVLLFDGQPKTDTIQMEEFLEETLAPPNFPSLQVRLPESSSAGDDVFLRFSAYVKNPDPGRDEALRLRLLRALWKLEGHLTEEGRGQRGPFLEGDHMTLADCRLLPKLNIVEVVCRHFRPALLPPDMWGVRRYLQAARGAKEFRFSCPTDLEILQAYRQVVRPI
ncbi:intracellular channel 3 [Podarcis lilfordi]|uniref:Intracellular channel 3 n=1 Tax=Podarcis lilfordi TaxID=74358 RepID=A0AA35LDY6_9SAUR|nr:intracellular channel 3 [Podarcis lilfordi]